MCFACGAAILGMGGGGAMERARCGCGCRRAASAMCGGLRVQVGAEGNPLDGETDCVCRSVSDLRGRVPQGFAADGNRPPWCREGLVFDLAARRAPEVARGCRMDPHAIPPAPGAEEFSEEGLDISASLYNASVQLLGPSIADQMLEAAGGWRRSGRR